MPQFDFQTYTSQSSYLVLIFVTIFYLVSTKTTIALGFIIHIRPGIMKILEKERLKISNEREKDDEIKGLSIPELKYTIKELNRNSVELVQIKNDFGVMYNSKSTELLLTRSKGTRKGK